MAIIKPDNTKFDRKLMPMGILSHCFDARIQNSRLTY